MVSVQPAVLWPVCRKMCLDPDSDVMPSLISVSSYHLFWLQYITGGYQIMLSIPHYWSWFFELGLKQCSCFVWFGPRWADVSGSGDESTGLAPCPVCWVCWHCSKAAAAFLWVSAKTCSLLCSAHMWEKTRVGVHSTLHGCQPARVKAGEVPAGQGAQNMSERKAARASWVPAYWLT